MINAIKRLFAKKPESRLPEIKISLSDLDFQKLVSGIIVHRGLNTITTVRICFKTLASLVCRPPWTTPVDSPARAACVDQLATLRKRLDVSWLLQR